MSNDEKFNSPDADLILRASGPPKRDFRVHKIILSLASPVFKDMCSIPQPAIPNPDDSEESGVARTDLVEVTDPPHALYIILRMIYPFTPPSLGGNLDTIVECLTIAEKYDIKGAMSKLSDALGRANTSQALRVYAIASRFGFANIAESTSHIILSTVDLTGILQLPDDYRAISASAYHKLVIRQASYRDIVVDIIKQTPLRSNCSSCPGGRLHANEVFKLRLSHLIMKGTPVASSACFDAWKKAYGDHPECDENCVPKFILAVVSRVDKQFENCGTSTPRRKSILKKA